MGGDDWAIGRASRSVLPAAPDPPVEAATASLDGQLRTFGPEFGPPDMRVTTGVAAEDRDFGADFRRTSGPPQLISWAEISHPMPHQFDWLHPRALEFSWPRPSPCVGGLGLFSLAGYKLRLQLWLRVPITWEHEEGCWSRSNAASSQVRHFRRRRAVSDHPAPAPPA